MLFNPILDNGWFRFVTNVGLKTAVSYAHDSRYAATPHAAGDPGAAWRESRLATFHQRRLLFAGLVLGFLALVAIASERQPDWVAAVLGLGAIFVVTETSCYYYAALLGFGFLSVRREVIGGALCALSASTWLFAWGLQEYDEIFTWISATTFVFLVFATLLVLRTPGASAPSPPATPS